MGLQQNLSVVASLPVVAEAGNVGNNKVTASINKTLASVAGDKTRSLKIIKTAVAATPFEINCETPAEDVGGGAGKDAVGRVVELDKLRFLLIENKTTGALVVGEGDTDALTGFAANIPAGGSTTFELGDGVDVATNAKNLKFTPAAAGTVDITIFGDNT